MLRYLVDPANAITAGGLLFSSSALYLALAGHVELAAAAGLWAVLADHLDGVVAGRTKNRSADMAKMGKSLDGFGDIIYGAILPAVILIEINGASIVAFLVATALLLAGVIRLSYFANFGKSDDGCFYGVPLSYDMPLMAALVLAQPLMPAQTFLWAVNIFFALLAAAHVAAIRVPSPNRAMYTAIALFTLLASAMLVHRGGK
jgi:CDP-diacylglycerol---serine O-phosphatidyltransferase